MVDEQVKVNDNIEQAYAIALANLRQCYSPLGIMAGSGNFTDLWARDCCQAGLGAVRAEKQDQQHVRRSLETLAQYQRWDGMIPIRIGSGTLIFKCFSIRGITPKGFGQKLDRAWEKLTRRKTEARYDTSKDRFFVFTEPLDPNLWFMISLDDYARQTRDDHFAKDQYQRLEGAAAWISSQDKDEDHLLEEGPYAGWADSVKKNGKVLYSNVLYARAMQAMAEICDRIGEGNRKIHFEDKVKRIRDAINATFWNGKYYIDWIDTERHGHMPTYENALSVVFGIADNSQANSVEDSLTRVFGEDMFFNPHSVTLPMREINLTQRLIGMKDYHNLSWQHIGCMDAVAKNKIGRKEDAIKVLGFVADQILRHGTTHEILDRNGNPINRLLYQSEGPFAWTAGLYVLAYHQIRE